MNKRLTMIAASLLMLTVAWAQGPNGSGTYYANANNKKGVALKTAMFGVINSPKVVKYKELGDQYQKTDKRTDGKLRDWYSNATNYTWDDAGGNSSEGAGWNKEHTVPQSWFSGSTPMYSDIVHVVPTDAFINNMRSSYPFGEVSSISKSSKNNYSKLGSSKRSGYSGTVFEPNDEIKGDIARIYFYMVTCYEDRFTNWKSGEATKVFSADASEGFQPWVLDMLMEWSKQDPVDDIETARNIAVKGVQGNRNPFVDYPGLEDYIWGDKTDKEFYFDNYEGGESTYVAMPVLSPDAGTYYHSVDVTLTCSTEDAVIYYTTDGADASEQSILYEGTFTLTESATIKAVAIKDGNRSRQAPATYIITNVDPEQPVDGQIALNNKLFGTSYNGSMDNVSTDLSGTANGITVVYALGGSQNRFCNDNEIRLYSGNTLTFSVATDDLAQLEFVFASQTPSKELSASTGTLANGVWTGNSKSVTVQFSGSSKHARLTGVKVKMAGSSGINMVSTPSLSGQRVIYNLRGQRVTNPTRGLYIVDGKKVFIE